MERIAILAGVGYEITELLFQKNNIIKGVKTQLIMQKKVSSLDYKKIFEEMDDVSIKPYACIYTFNETQVE